MRWRIAIGSAVLAVVVAVVGCVVALAGGSSGQPTRTVTDPTRYWLRQHAFLPPGAHPRIDLSEVARTLLGLESDFRDAHHVHTYNAIFRDELVTHACTYIFGHSVRVDRALQVHRFRFHVQASGPTLSSRLPGGTDHGGYALQCGYSRGPLGTRLLALSVSSGGLRLHNLTTYAQARQHGVTAGFAFTARPHGLATQPRVRHYLSGRVGRVAYRG